MKNRFPPSRPSSSVKPSVATLSHGNLRISSGHWLQLLFLHLFLSVFTQIVSHLFLLNIFSKENEKPLEDKALSRPTSGAPTVTRAKSSPNNQLLIDYRGVFLYVAGNTACKLGRLVNWKDLRLWSQAELSGSPLSLSSLGYFSSYACSFPNKIGTTGCDTV